MIIAINYANEAWKCAQALNSKTALENGADEVIEYGPKDLDPEFAEKNADILKEKKGNGYWLWKPYVIAKTMSKMGDSDYLMYSDSGFCYVDNIKFLIQNMQEQNVDYMTFYPERTENVLEKFWTKRDAFLLMECDFPKYTESLQTLGGIIVLKKTLQSLRLIENWLHYAQDRRILTDDENCMGKSNYDGFMENRHDQSILSLLVKKDNTKVFRCPSVGYGENKYEWEKYSRYPKILESHHMPNVNSMDEIVSRRGRMNLIYTNKEFLNIWEQGKSVIFYSTGFRTKKFLKYIRQKHRRVEAFVISDNIPVDSEMEKMGRVFHLSELPYEKEKCIIVVLTKHAEVYDGLSKSGFDYVTPDFNFVQEVYNSLYENERSNKGMDILW